MRIDDKTKEIEKYLQELYKIVPNNLKEYKRNFQAKAACERYFEKIVEAVVDLAFLIIKERNLELPEEDKQAFDVLFNGNIISKELAERLKDAKGMRNIIAHEYGTVDDELVYNSITEELEKDVNEFIKVILKKR